MYEAQPGRMSKQPVPRSPHSFTTVQGVQGATAHSQTGSVKDTHTYIAVSPLCSPVLLSSRYFASVLNLTLASSREQILPGLTYSFIICNPPAPPREFLEKLQALALSHPFGLRLSCTAGSHLDLHAQMY